MIVYTVVPIQGKSVCVVGAEICGVKEEIPEPMKLV